MVGIVAGAATDGARLYVADAALHHVARLDLPSKQVAILGREGAGPGEFRMPQLIAPCASGTVVVYDAALRRFSLFDSAGRFTRSFDSPIAAHSARGLLCTAGDELVLSATAATGIGARFVLHWITLRGTLRRSAAQTSRAFAGEEDRLFGDAGPITVDPAGMVWLSRGGAELRIEGYTRDGVLRRVIRLQRPIVEAWQAPLATSSQGGRTSVAGRIMLGTVGMLQLAGSTLVNVARIKDGKTKRFDAFRITDGKYLASWTAATGTPAADVSVADSEGWGYAMVPTGEGIVRYRLAAAWLTSVR